VFLDTAVQGLEYIAGLQTGVTNANGHFSASPGTTVLFKLGDVVIGLAPFERQLTPISLVSGAVDETDPTVTNIARLLQSLDSDGDLSNGIGIDQAVRDAGVGIALKFDQSEANFENDPSVAILLAAAGSAGLVDTASAQAHLRNSIRGSHAGEYGGHFTGDDTGTFHVFVDRAGRLAGAAFSNVDQELFGVSGQVDLLGTGVFGNTTTQSTFDGTVGAGVVEGDWANAILATSGTYSGNRTLAPTPVLDPAELAPFLGTYTGTYVEPGDSGPFSTDVLASGDLEFTISFAAEIRATVVGIASGVATFRGMSDEGTRIAGTILADGTMSGTIVDLFGGGSGSFSGSL